MQIFRVTTTASRNKGQVRYGTYFRAMRIWLANRNQPDNKVTIEVMTGDFRDVTAEWEAGTFEPEKTGVTVTDDLIPATAGDDTVHSTGTGWPE